MTEATWCYYTRICKLKYLQCWIIPINNWSWSGGNFGGSPESMTGTTVSQLQSFVILVGWGEARNSYFYVKCYLLTTTMHTPCEKKKKLKTLSTSHEVHLPVCEPQVCNLLLGFYFNDIICLLIYLQRGMYKNRGSEYSNQVVLPISCDLRPIAEFLCVAFSGLGVWVWKSYFTESLWIENGLTT